MTELRRYNVWAGNPNGRVEDTANCIEAVWTTGRGSMQYQCSRKRGSGPNGLYCSVHAKKHLDRPIGTWYRTSSYSFGIKVVEVYSETKSRLGVKEQGGKVSQTNKRGYYDFWPTHEEAVEHLRIRLESIRKNYESAQKEFEKTTKEKL